MPVTLETSLVIKARDETGAAFDKIESKFKKLATVMRSMGAAPVGALRQAAVAADRADHLAGRLSRTVAATYAGMRAVQLGQSVVGNYEKFDDLVRYQRAVLGINEEQQKPLLSQATRLGGSTPYDAIQVAEAQLTLAQRGVKLEFITPIIEAAAEHAQAMNVGLPEAARTIEGLLFSTGKVVTDANEALAISRKAVDEMVKTAKISGMSDEDLREGIKFAGLAGSTAGLSDPTILAMMGLQHRANVPGSEAGVAVRALAAHLVAPTREGLDALAAMGIDYSKFTSMPGGLRPENARSFFLQKFGKSISKSGMARIAEIFGDEDIVGNRGEFIKHMFDALAPGFGTAGRDGKMRPQDSRALTKGIAEFYKDSVGAVDSERLLRAIMGAHPTLGQINALFGPKQGARIAAIMRDAEKFEEYYKDIKDVPEGFAASIGRERMGGASGAIKRAGGSWTNVEAALGRAFDSEITHFFNIIARMEQRFAELEPQVQKEIGAAAALATGLVGVGAVLKGFELGLSGSAAALSRFVPLLGIFAALPEVAQLAAYVAKAAQDKFGDQQTIGTVPGVGWVPGAENLPGLGKFAPAPAEVKGSADLNVNVQVEPSDSFVARIISAIRNEINVFGNEPGSGIGTSGSTGLSMPETVGGNP